MRVEIKAILITLVLVFSGVNTLWAQGDRLLVRQGNRLYRKQQFAKSEVEYRKAIARNAENSQAIYNLGCALMQQQKDSAAIVQYERAGKLETNKIRKAKVYHNIGVICQTHQMYGEAVKAYEEALRNNPNDNETRYNLALCKRQNKQQNKGGGGKDNKKKNDQDKQKQNQKQQNKDKNKDKDQQKQQQSQEQMSKENAEQLLNAVVQEEKATQQRLKKAMQKQGTRRLQKNW